jgi:hypothetical protein
MNKIALNRLGMSLEEYFEYILDSKTNGQHKQAKELFGELSDEQKEAFFVFAETLYFYEVDEDELNSEMINFRNYFKNNQIRTY